MQGCTDHHDALTFEPDRRDQEHLDQSREREKSLLAGYSTVQYGSRGGDLRLDEILRDKKLRRLSEK
jgi:hypothetical protein